MDVCTKIQPAPSNIFTPRANIKPYEYPELLEFVDAIRHSYWVHTEFDYAPDVQDVKVKLSETEKTIVLRSMLAISQIESAVKTFWGRIHSHLPKPEIAKVGATFSENEVRHEDAYSHLLTKLGLDEEFENLAHIPAMKDRIAYINKINNKAKEAADPRDFFEALIFFSVLIENVSLFSQFYILMGFNKHKNLLKGMSNAIAATSLEEDVHADFGFTLFDIIRTENPGWFDLRLQNRVSDVVYKAYLAEQKVLDWVYELGDSPDAAPRKVVEAYIQERLNRSMKRLGLTPHFEIDADIAKDFAWFDEEILSTTHNDFFHTRSVNYSKKQKQFNSTDLF